MKKLFIYLFIYLLGGIVVPLSADEVSYAPLSISSRAVDIHIYEPFSTESPFEQSPVIRRNQVQDEDFGTSATNPGDQNNGPLESPVGSSAVLILFVTAYLFVQRFRIRKTMTQQDND